MNCLHFRTDRATGRCPDCGWVAGGSPQAVYDQVTQIQETVVDALKVGIALPETEDVRDLIASLKRQHGTPPAPAPMPPAELVSPLAAQLQASLDYETLKAERDKAAEAATPDWIKEAVPVRTVGTVQPSIAEESAPTRPNGDYELLPYAYDGIQPAGVNDAPVPSTESKDYAPGTYPEEPVFSVLLGDAGTGKSYSLRQRAEQYDDAKLCATTGIAAVNLGGTTINSILQYGDTAQLRANYEIGKLGALLKRLTNSGYYRLLVDEMSMMDGHQLDILVTAIEELNEWLGQNGKRSFGMTLCGDFAQLPPVNAPFVFQRPMWARFTPNIVKLTQPMRQTDPEFLRGLQAVRRGDRRSAMDYFGPRIVQGSEDKFDGSTLVSTNNEVDRYNKLRMMDLAVPSEYFKADRVGEQLSEWTKNIPDSLEMKPGALAMILANRTIGEGGDREILYANGDLCHYRRKVNETVAEVELLRGGMVVQVQAVLKEKGVATGHTGRKLPRNEVKGSIRYMPLRIAYATTVHKAQGLSLDRVQLMFHNKFWASPGMLFVALSRARTPQGLRLVGTPEQFEARITVNPDVRAWL